MTIPMRSSVYLIVILIITISAFSISCSDTGLNFTESECYEISDQIPTWQERVSFMEAKAEEDDLVTEFWFMSHTELAEFIADEELTRNREVLIGFKEAEQMRRTDPISNETLDCAIEELESFGVNVLEIYTTFQIIHARIEPTPDLIKKIRYFPLIDSIEPNAIPQENDWFSTDAKPNVIGEWFESGCGCYPRSC